MGTAVCIVFFSAVFAFPVAVPALFAVVLCVIASPFAYLAVIPAQRIQTIWALPLAVMPIAVYFWDGQYPWTITTLPSLWANWLIALLSPFVFVIPEVALAVLIASIAKGIRPFLIVMAIASCALTYVIAFQGHYCQEPGPRQF